MEKSVIFFEGSAPGRGENGLPDTGYVAGSLPLID
jgi:hypothetical protein